VATTDTGQSHPAATKRTAEEQKRRNQALMDLLQSWIDVSDEEAQEQKETGEYLRKALDEDRPPRVQALLVSLHTLLDAGPLGLVTNPRTSPEFLECTRWLYTHLAGGDRVYVPAIADYEVRRELIRAGKRRGIARLDALGADAEYLPITTDAMLLAAHFWARARQRGRPSAPDLGLDADVILAAQAATLPASDDQVVVAAANVRHLSLFVDARHWRDIA
jgi:predicted nucleic acid-binding protein